MDIAGMATAPEYYRPLPQLVFEAQAVHRQHHPPNRVQLCAYCPQSARYSTGIETYPLTLRGSLRQHGATRLCMGAAWRPAPKGKAFERVLERVPMVRKLGMEACVTLGRASAAQAQQLAAAGLTAYNPNLDPSPEF
ncbi:hypothetical protein NW830_07815 [Synechococcus sp. OH30]